MLDNKLYSRVSDGALVLELWGASTKHPDCVFEYTREERRSETCFQARWTQDFKWLLSIAGKMLWVGTAIELTNMAKAFYEGCMLADHPDEVIVSLYDCDEWVDS